MIDPKPGLSGVTGAKRHGCLGSKQMAVSALMPLLGLFARAFQTQDEVCQPLYIVSALPSLAWQH